YSNELRFMKYHPITGYDRVKYMMGIVLSHKNEMKILKDTSSLSDEITIVAVSRRTREELVSNGVRASSVHAILNGVDKGLFKPIDRTEAEEVLERRYGVKVKGFTIAHIGLGARKGTHILVKALAMLKKRGVNFTALLAGKVGPPSYEQYLNELIRRSGLLENVKLLGWIREEDVPYLYNAADVTVVPSYSEGSPLVIPESLACGTPVIATDVGGNREYLELVGLENLLVTFSAYDFSTKLFLKISELADSVSYASLRLSSNIGAVSSWDDVRTEYLKIFRRAKILEG
ncbi:MAG: glycosyltransferase family 4 protein, partial [Candidatus Bathyarchaeia archaeon]